jgi:hypothetical protein
MGLNSGSAISCLCDLGATYLNRDFFIHKMALYFLWLITAGTPVPGILPKFISYSLVLFLYPFGIF